MILNRRSFVGGLIVAPAIVKIESIMPIHDPIVNGLVFLSEKGDIYHKWVWYAPFSFKYYNPPDVYHHFTYGKNPRTVTPTKLSNYADVIREQTSEKIGYTQWREL